MTNFRSPSRKNIPVIDRTNDGNGHAPLLSSDIPEQNVVNLRAVIAERELERARKRRAEAMKKPTARRDSFFVRRANEKARKKKKDASIADTDVNAAIINAAPQQSQTEEAQSVVSLVIENANPSKHDGWISLDAPTTETVDTPTIPAIDHTFDIVEDIFDNTHQCTDEIFPSQAMENVSAEQSDDTLPFFHFSFHTVVKPLVVFCAFAFLFVVPAGVSATLRKTDVAKDIIQASTQSAFQSLERGASAMRAFQFSNAQTAFADAVGTFTEATNEFQDVNPVVSAIAPYVPGKGKEYTSGSNLLLAGKELAIAGEHIAKAFILVTASDTATNAFMPNKESENTSEISMQKNDVTSSLVLLHSALFPAVDHVGRAAEYLNNVDVNALPEDKRAIILFAQEELPAIHATLVESVRLVEIFLTLLGHDSEKRYLVLFQNNRELRPTGGFIGSLALVDINKGIVEGLDVPAGGVYDVAGQFDQTIIAPSPLQLVNPYWNLQDANWFPHFPASAQKIQWFYEHSRGASVDGVITFIPDVVQELLRITGPIDMTDDFGVVIDADNFYDEVQMRAEEKFDVTRESKKIIGAMMPRLLKNVTAQLNSPENVIELMRVMKGFLDAKDILLYMNDPLLQRDLSAQGWTGEIATTDRDYLSVIHANIAGGKTDGVIDNIIHHEATIADDGSVVDTVTLTRVHHGSLDDPLTNVDNTDYVRFYIPQGSALLTAEGFKPPDPTLFLRPDANAERDADLQALSGDIYVNETTHVANNNEFGKMVVGGWMQTRVGGSSTVKISYRLPFQLHVGGFFQRNDRYSLVLQKQPGSFDATVTSDVRLPSNIRRGKSFPDDFQEHRQWMLEKDDVAGFVVTPSQ